MTKAQQAAMEQLKTATTPIAVVAGTARVLEQQYGYIERHGDGWSLTHRGVAYLAGRATQARYDEQLKQVTSESRQWAERVVCWLKAHQRFPRNNHGAWRYAEHVARCDFLALDPVLPFDWDEASRIYVEETVRGAALCLKDFDEAARTATERGVGVSVSYESDERVPRSRRQAAREAAADSAAEVSLRRYRERRPSGSTA